MNKDYYRILGIDKNASDDEIKKAFRKKAHEHHPDKPSGNADKFKEINEAYGVLSNKEKRSQYDRFGSNFQNAGGGFNWGDFNNSQGFQWSSGGENINFDFGNFNMEDILNSVFGGGFNRRPRKGPNINLDITISFKDSIFGTEVNLSYERRSDKSKENLSIKIPAGIENGESLRIRERGERLEGGQPGDLFVRVHVKEHKTLKREGYHLITDLDLKLSEAILGSKKEIDSVSGDKITISIPKGSNNGDILRLKNEGVPTQSGKRGDLLIRIRLNIPHKINSKAEKLFKELNDLGY